ncbi:KdsC family phosphatase [Flavobacterium sp.]|uniref:KdsC family phosphatase n=1 Tax=Flavobacterium sp. TaxID=239 RepID=UPI002FDAF22F
MLPKLIVTDIDGVWTDGSMYYDQTGNELKRFHTYDSAGVLFARLCGIPVAILTGETTQIVARRAEKLQIPYVYQGVKNKVATLEPLLETLGITWADCAFMGDDINDALLLERVGFSACPANAPAYIQSRVHLVTQKKGGEGAFREFVETLLEQNQLLDSVVQQAIRLHEKST